MVAFRLLCRSPIFLLFFLCLLPLPVFLNYDPSAIASFVASQEEAVRSLCNAIETYYASDGPHKTSSTTNCPLFDPCYAPSTLETLFQAEGLNFGCESGALDTVTGYGVDAWCGPGGITGAECGDEGTSGSRLTFQTPTILWLDPDSPEKQSLACSRKAISGVMEQNRINGLGAVKWQYIEMEFGAHLSFPGRSLLYQHPLLNSSTGERDTCREFVPECDNDPGIQFMFAAATGPKDVVVVVDASEAMLQFGRMRHVREAVATVIWGLGVNDRFRILAYGTETTTLCDHCSGHGSAAGLIDMGGRTREFYRCYLTCLQEEYVVGMVGFESDYEKAFLAAFDQLDASPGVIDPSFPSAAILFITGGDPTQGSTEQLVEEIVMRNAVAGSSGDGRVAHVNAYSFGGKDVAPSLLRDIVCANQGVWNFVDDAKEHAMKNEVLQFYKSFKIGPNPSTQKFPTQWTGMYHDSWGLGEMTTVYSACHREDGSLLAMAGVDVIWSQFEGSWYDDFDSQVGLEIWDRSHWDGTRSGLTENELNSFRPDGLCTSSRYTSPQDVGAIVAGVLAGVVVLIIMFAMLAALLGLYCRLNYKERKHNRFVRMTDPAEGVFNDQKPDSLFEEMPEMIPAGPEEIQQPKLADD